MGGPRQGNDRVRAMYVKLYVIKFETDSTIIQKCSRVKGKWEELRVLNLIGYRVHLLLISETYPSLMLRFYSFIFINVCAMKKP